MHTMSKIMGVTLTAFVMATSAHAAPEDAFGTWLHPGNGSHVKLYACGGGLCAQIVKNTKPGGKDDKNSDESKRGRNLNGLVIMSGAAKSGDNGWKGKLYSPEDGDTFNGSITVLSKNQLKLEGCALLGLVCKGVTWSRIGS